MRNFLALAAVALLVISVAGCSDDETCTTCPPDGTAPTLSYVGTQSCGTTACHQTIVDMFMESGHPYKLTAVPGAVGPTFPWDSEHASGAILANDGPPPGTAWTDFVYTIGGYGWKARFVMPDGNVYTTGTQAQLNLWATGPEWVPYNMGTVKPYNYSCFKCHTTGASEEGSWPAGTTGFGTFQYGGVQCEECHGQGSQHASDPARFEMTVDRSAALCGRCHTRDAQNRVAVSGGYIRHHEQFDELIHSPHAAYSCNDCHDPHASVVYDNVALGQGVKTDCLTCHPGYDGAGLDHNSLATCTDCHMPKAAKSARVTSNPYVADITSHTFTILADSLDKSAMWTSDGKFLAQDEFGRGMITLDFACYSCHKDDPTSPTNPGAPWSDQTLGELARKAAGIHAGAPTPVAVQK